MSQPTTNNFAHLHPVLRYGKKLDKYISTPCPFQQGHKKLSDSRRFESQGPLTTVDKRCFITVSILINFLVFIVKFFLNCVIFECRGWNSSPVVGSIVVSAFSRTDAKLQKHSLIPALPRRSPPIPGK